MNKIFLRMLLNSNVWENNTTSPCKVHSFRILTALIFIPADGRWSEWSVWSTCSKSCGDGVRTRERKCDNPEPVEGGRQCDGEDKQYSYCKASDCCKYLYNYSWLLKLYFNGVARSA